MKCVFRIPDSDIQPRGELLDHERVGEQGLAEAAVLLADRQAEDAKLLQLLHEPVG